MPLRVNDPIAPDVKYSTPRSGGGPLKSGGGGARVIGGLVVLALLALLLLVVLIVGGLVLIAFGVYVGVLARRRPARIPIEPPTVPIPIQGWSLPPAPPVPARPPRMPFGLTPSYGLSASCIVVGFLMVIVGLALLPEPDDAATRPATSTAVAAAPVVPPSTPPSRQPAATDPGPTPAPTEAPPARATSEPEPVETREKPAEIREQPRERPKPVMQRAAGDNDDGGTVFYKNCDAARAAGAAPLRKGEPGYRSKLDRDGDGVACE